MNDKHADVLREARERFDECCEADEWNREQALDDLQFLVGEQWPEDVRSERELSGRPMLTINRMPQFLRQVTGDIRRTNPAVSIGPADGGADKETAEIFEGLVRSIESMSDATTVYEQSGECAAACGMAAFRILTDYAEDSFDQEARIERIPNPFSVYFDPEARDVTRKDADFAFVIDRMSKDAFRKAYPKAVHSDWDAGGLPGYLDRWYDGDEYIQVAEYFCKKSIKREIGLLEDGSVIDMTSPGAALRNPIRTRQVDDHKVVWYKMTGQEVLEGPVDMPTRHIPVVAVVGEEIHIGERVVRSSVIRYAKDPQRLYNYSRTANAEIIALQPKAPYKVTPNQIKGLEGYWEAANTSNKPFLPYNPDPLAPGAPQRETPPVASSGLIQEVSLAAEDMKATTGIYDAAVGERSNETSGVAIQQRQIESDISTSIYVDNLAKSIAHCGRILVDTIPVIYDTTRQVRLLGVDESEKIVTVNQPMRDELGNEVRVNDLRRGKYDVRITTGPNYSTKRQESAQAQIEFIRAVPSVAAGVMDLIAKNMDWPGADQFAARLEKMLPPGLLERDPSDMTPEEQQQYMMEQQAAQQAQQLQMRAQTLEMMDKESTIKERAAEIDKVVAETEKIEVQTAVEAMELAAMNGQIDQVVAQQAIAVLTAMQAQPAPPPGMYPIN